MVSVASLASLTLGLASLAYAQTARSCPTSNVCYSLNIPDATASSGNGDIYFQITAPSSYEWVALGQGTRMAGSNIFVLYTNGGGTNVTLSPRLGQGHFEPQFNGDAQVTLLEGSGVANDMLTANVRCSNCNSWTGGSMDFASASTTWIWAVKAGAALNTDSTSADISEHDNYGTVRFTSSSARGGASLNPFLASTTTDSSSSSSSAAASPSSSDSTEPATDESSSSSSTTPTSTSTIILAHGVLGALAWVIIFPLGSILLRLISSSKSIWIHAALQGLGHLVFTAAVGLGIYYANQIRQLNAAHPIIGLVVFALLFLQPVLGLMHHSQYKKVGRRSAVSHAHVWLGRAIITLGIINGGLGLQMAGDASRGQIVAYAVVAGVMWVAYVASAVWGEVRKGKAVARKGSGESFGEAGMGKTG
ncbi:Cytochrome b561 and DOMON domain-containing protein [Sphaceloma murrayae]|uniref:Cytochrome b561 and DOMON domain-containing protein n=1 Tax=Sphaceloma murrayae TaxID=2082308 RepID=A0A2K1QTI9_9PEZI|nr:Cytochrome b561 and DOMON domain-containing protein [Sphaceloma murrayae]